MPQQLVLDNAEILVGDGSSLRGHVVVEAERIVAVTPGRYASSETDPSVQPIDLQGMFLSPGLIDLMLLGGFNRSIVRDDPRKIAQSYAALGVTGCQFCIGTLPWETMERIAANLREGARDPRPEAAHILGWYLEGPFQQPDLSGASLREHALPPNSRNVSRLIEEFDDVLTMVNVAPGLAGDVEAVRLLCDAGKVVTMAHSNATADRVLACVEAGTSVLGHVWDNNAGRIGDSGVQQPTLEHVALTDERVRFIHLIADGVHAHPIMIDLVLRCRGVESVCLVSDGNIRSCCDDGPFEWDDGQCCTKQGGVCRTPEGWLAGGATLVPDLLRRFMKMTGLPVAHAIQTATHNPAQCLGVSDRMGRIAPGLAADLVVWDEHMQVRRVWIAGRELDHVSDFTEIKS